MMKKSSRQGEWHPYSDCPPTGITALYYTYEELFGEKVSCF